jgi:hypothetical protein
MGADVGLGQDGNGLEVIKSLNVFWVEADLPPAIAIKRHGPVGVFQDGSQRLKLPGFSGPARIILAAFQPTEVSQIGTPLPPGPDRAEELSNYYRVEIHSRFQD